MKRLVTLLLLLLCLSLLGCTKTVEPSKLPDTGFAGVTDNIVQVESESDLPDPVNGEIQLENRTVYYFTGIVTSPYTLKMGNPSPLIGSHGSTDGFIHTGGKTAIKSEGNPFFMRNFYVHSPGGTLFDLSADNQTEFLMESSAISDAVGFGNIRNLGTIEGYRVPTIKGVSIEQFNSGLTLTGTSRKVFIADSPFRTVTNDNVTVITFDENASTEIVDIVDNYYKGMQNDTQIINVSQQANIADIFQYRGNTHGDTINHDNILTGNASLEAIGYRIGDSYPLRDSDVDGRITGNITDAQTITGSGTSWQKIDINSNLYNAERSTQSSNSILQYTGKRDVNAVITSRVVVTGVDSDDIRTKIVKNNENTSKIYGYGATFNRGAFVTISESEQLYLERYDNVSVYIQNYDGTSDVDVQELTLSIND